MPGCHWLATRWHNLTAEALSERQRNRVMRCMACAMEMRLVRRVPDQGMMVSGNELHTFECPGCGSREQRLVLVRTMDEVGAEKMHLPPSFATPGVQVRQRMSLVAQAARRRAQLALAASDAWVAPLVARAKERSGSVSSLARPLVASVMARLRGASR